MKNSLALLFHINRNKFRLFSAFDFPPGICVPKISFLIFGLISLFFITSSVNAKSKVVIGRAEKVRVFPGNIVLKAKIDTGTKTSSINAPAFTEFERDGEKWVKFEFVNGKGEKVTVEERVVRTAKFKRMGNTLDKRPVIKLGICIGNVYKEVEVNLADRKQFAYQMLIGRNFLIDDFVIDPSVKYTREPECKSVSGDE